MIYNNNTLLRKSNKDYSRKLELSIWVEDSFASVLSEKYSSLQYVKVNLEILCVQCAARWELKIRNSRQSDDERQWQES